MQGSDKLSGKSLKDLYKSLEGSLGKVLKAISEEEVETCHMKHPRSVRQSSFPVGPGEKQLEGIL